MQLTRLRIVGFKSFVEPTEFMIEPGLTGVIGPNGCGKSNLVEALRWVMGESSYKSMRASGMDDVIFGGSGHRPARNTAEVTVTVDNADRTAPAAFNDSETLEISRKIAREAGSTYRINGREVRARDVQLLFADAATGARSAAMVRQGQISEIIAAKPQARRRILEDAAGIAGLHARRHEAELRLRAAEENLSRVEDVLGQIDQQAEGLKRQSRQATRYRTLSADIRRFEATLQLIGYREAQAESVEAENALSGILAEVAERTEKQAEAARLQAIAAHTLPGLRDREAQAAATLQRLVLARAELEAEETRSRDRAQALERRLVELDRDRERQQALINDAGESIARLEEEARGLGEEGADSAQARAAAEASCATRDAALAEAERAFDAAQAALSDLNARRAALERSAREEAERADRLARQREEREAQHRDLAEAVAAADLEALRENHEEACARAEAADERAASAREALVTARETESRARGPVAESERRAQRLETEAATLAKFFAAPGDDAYAPLIDSVSVDKGFEIALGAALGEDLEAAEDACAPTHWRALDATGDRALPDEATPLARHVAAPPVLARVLAQIGVVADRETGARLQEDLSGGQILVTREGDLWRWDGYAAAGDAPTAAARRLSERNRLGDLEREAAQARDEAELARRDLDFAQASARAAASAENQAMEAARQARRVRDEAGTLLSQAERADADRLARLAGIKEALARLDADAQEAEGRAEQAREALEDLAPAGTLEAELEAARRRAVEARTESAQAHAVLQGLVREAEMVAQRPPGDSPLEIRATGVSGRKMPGPRFEVYRRAYHLRAPRKLEDFARGSGRFPHASSPPRGRDRTRRDPARREAADRLAEGETAQAETGIANRSRGALGPFSGSARIGPQPHRAVAMRSRPASASWTGRFVTIWKRHRRASTPLPVSRRRHGCPLRARVEEKNCCCCGMIASASAPVQSAREEELSARSKSARDTLGTERDDLVAAIKRLRQAVSSLNREGRERLLAAFDVVNGHFRNLFTTLFRRWRGGADAGRFG